MKTTAALLLDIYDTLFDALGPSGWWPGDTPFEVAVGAVLTQNTTWTNVERAIGNLKAADALDGPTLWALPEERLAELIRPAGYFRLKAKRLRAFLAFLKEECDFVVEGLAGRDLAELRGALLGVKGVGPETADSILLYALGRPTFVVDAYTRRVCSRHGLVPEDVGYEELRALFMDRLEPDPALFNEYHALLVRVAKDWCRKREGRCDVCPLRGFLS